MADIRWYMTFAQWTHTQPKWKLWVLRRLLGQWWTWAHMVRPEVFEAEAKRTALIRKETESG